MKHVRLLWGTPSESRPTAPIHYPLLPVLVFTAAIAPTTWFLPRQRGYFISLLTILAIIAYTVMLTDLRLRTDPVFLLLFGGRPRRADDENALVGPVLKGQVPVGQGQLLGEEVAADRLEQRVAGMVDHQPLRVGQFPAQRAGPGVGVEQPAVGLAVVVPVPRLDVVEPLDQLALAGPYLF